MAQKLFDKASLVMIPSQYKQGKIYNIKPEDQSSSFEFERGSDATRVNSDGLIELVEPLPTGAETIVNGSFTGGSTGWVLTTSWSYDVDRVFFDKDYNRIDNLIQVNQSWTISQGKYYRLSFDIENVDQNDLSYIFIRIVDVAGTGVQDIANSYQYYGDGNHTIIFSPVADSTRIDFYARGNVSGSSGGSFYIDNISIKEIQGDTPRLDYSGTEPVLLLEPQRTNDITYSEDFSQWSNLGTRVAFEHNTTDTLSPEGKYNATKLTKNTSGNPTLRLSTITASNPYVFSCWAKAGTSDKIVLDISDSDNITFTLTDEWQRFEVTTNSAANNWVDIELRTDADIGSYVYVWGAQAEQGSYATSYIPTHGQAETRLRDGISLKEYDFAPSNNYTLFFDFDLANQPLVSNFATKIIRDPNSQAIHMSWRWFNRNGEHVFVPFLDIDSSYIFNTNVDENRTDTGKIVLSVDGGTYKMFTRFNGVTTTRLATSQSPTQVSKIDLYYLGEHKESIRSFVIFDQTLTDQECISLTI